MRFRILLVLSVFILLTLVQVGSSNPNSSYLPADSIAYFPDDEWTMSIPEDQGMNSTVLDEMVQFIEDSEAPIKGLVVSRNGYIVKEVYRSYNTEITTHNIFSCTKSFTGALVGIAIKEGFIDNVSQKVLDFFPDMTIEHMDSRKGNMTLENVLTMTTGLDWNEWNTTYQDSENMYNQMFGSPNPIQFFLNLPTVYDPGTHWEYCTGASHLLSAIIQRATSMTTREFADAFLFDPLNITIGGWAVDFQGINNGGTQLYVTSRTMAKLGLLYLNNGTWDGHEIMTEEYVAQSIYPHISIDATRHYGYQWWLNTDEGYFSARGSNGQYIIVVPEYNIVISIAANADEHGEDINEDILEFIARSIMDGRVTTSGFGVELLFIITGVGVVALVVIIGIYVRRS